MNNHNVRQTQSQLGIRGLSKTLIRYIRILATMILLFALPLQADLAENYIECTGFGYKNTDATPADIYGVDPNNPLVNVIWDDINIDTTAMGYSLQHGLFYLLDESGDSKVLKSLDNNKTLKEVTITNLPSGEKLRGIIMDVSYDGWIYINEQGDSEKHVFKLKLSNDGTVADYNTTLEFHEANGSEIKVGSDIAVHPLTGDIYSFDALSIDALDHNTGERVGEYTVDYSNLDKDAIPDDDAYAGSQWFDGKGRLYAWMNLKSDDGDFHLIRFTFSDTDNRAIAEDLGGMVDSEGNDIKGSGDGAACPAGLILTKDVNSSTAEPGETIQYTFKIQNDYQYSMVIDFNDTMPDGFDIVSGSVSISGDNSHGTITQTDEKILIEDINISGSIVDPAGTKTVTITLNVKVSNPHVSGTFTNQAELRDVPAIFGGKILSDNNLSTSEKEPTPVYVPNVAPTLQNDNISVGADLELTGNVISGNANIGYLETNGTDTDLNGDTMSVTEFVVNGTTHTVSSGSEVTVELDEGNLTIGSDGSYRFVPVEGFVGDVPSVTYTVSDGTNTSTASLNIHVMKDTDKDGIPNYYDIDDDNDGILDTYEYYCDQPSVANAKIGNSGDVGKYQDQIYIFQWDEDIFDKLEVGDSQLFRLADGLEINATLVAFSSSSDYNDFGPETLGYELGDHLYGSDGYPALRPQAKAISYTYTFHFSATKNGHDYPLHLIGADAENTGSNEYITFTTDGQPWQYLEDSVRGAARYRIDQDGKRIVYDYTTDRMTLFVSPEAHEITTLARTERSGREGAAFALRLVCDQDNDGLPNYLDLDSDNDGITDTIEAQIPASTGNDTDNDGLDDAYDTDQGGTAVAPVDTDTDGIEDYRDLDSDNDGISDLQESGQDVSQVDADHNGVLDDTTDIDADGILVASDANDSNIHAGSTIRPFDNDGDGIVDYLDLDSDGDGIADAIEAQPTSGYVGNDGNVSNDVDGNGVPPYGIVVPIDNDGDGNPDYLDEDSDDDMSLDDNESGYAGIMTGLDVDRDGIDDGLHSSYLDPDGEVVNSPFDTMLNNDSNSSDVDFRSLQDTDGDGVPDRDDLDDDNDGIADMAEYGSCTSGVVRGVLSEDFGVGVETNLAPPAITTLIYDPDKTLDGEYSIVQDPQDAADFKGWISAGDHTGNPEGRMMVINASEDPSEMYRRTINVTPYSNLVLDFWLLNVVKRNERPGYMKLPNVALRIEDMDGNQIGEEVNTGDVPQDETWHNYQLGINVANHRQVQIVLFNNAPGGDGNDLAIDDIYKQEVYCDYDKDGIPDYLDLDGDNDGITDLVESGQDPSVVDTDNDGRVDSTFADADGDGLLAPADLDDHDPESNGTVTPPDDDNDSIPNFLDLDSDNDGIPDAVEAQPTSGYVGNDGNVSNDVDDGGVPSYGYIVPKDSDGDGVADYLDLDSDDDNRSDTNESGLTLQGEDNDNNGIDDAIGATYIDPNGIVNNPSNDLSNEAGDTKEVAYREINIVPLPLEDNRTISEDNGTLTGNLLNNDSDEDNDTLRIGSFGIDTNGDGVADVNLTLGVEQNVTDADGNVIGTIVVDRNGSYTFTPEENYDGEVPPILYTVDDGNGGTATATLNITIDPVDDAPTLADGVTALPDIDSNDSDTIADVNMSQYFSDVDNNQSDLNFTATGLPAGLTIDPQTGVISGTIDSNASVGGEDGDYNVTITVTDPDGKSVTTTFTWHVENPAPKAVDDNASVSEDGNVSGNLLGNDSDEDNDTLSITGVGIDTNGDGVADVNLSLGVEQNVTDADGNVIGTIVVDRNGSYTFAPIESYDGDVPPILYTINDGNGGEATARLNITIEPVDDAPTLADGVTALPDIDSNDSDTIADVNMSQYFSDVDNNQSDLNFTATGLPAGLTIDPQTGVISGTIDSNASVGGEDGDYNVTITVTDPDGKSVSTTFTWHVENPAPVAQEDNVTMAEDNGTLSGNLINNSINGGTLESNGTDSDSDGDPLTVTAFEINGTTYTIEPGESNTTTIPGMGNITISSDGNFTFTPEANYNGEVPPILYTVDDGNGGTATSTLNITIDPVDDAPIVENNISDINSSDSDTVELNVSKHFSDIDNNRTDLNFTATGLPAGLTIDPQTGVISGTIDSNASVGGEDGDYNVTITVTDPDGKSVSTTFTWHIENPAPSDDDESASLRADEELTGNLLDNAEDSDGDSLSVSQVMVDIDGDGETDSIGIGESVTLKDDNGDTIGVLRIDENGHYSFVPDISFMGDVPEITYMVKDSNGATVTSTLSIYVDPADVYMTNDKVGTSTTINPLTDRPSLDPSTMSLDPESVEGVEGVVGKDSNGDGNIDTLYVPGEGTWRVQKDGKIIFTPDEGYTGDPTPIAFSAKDHKGNSLPDTTIYLDYIQKLEEDKVAVPVGDSAVIDILENDDEIDTHTLTLDPESVNGVGEDRDGDGTIDEVIVDGQGVWRLNADGMLKFIPEEGFSDDPTPIAYVAKDKSGNLLEPTTVHVRYIAPDEEPPVAVDDKGIVVEDGERNVPIAILANSDTYGAFSPDPTQPVMIASTSKHGGSLVYDMGDPEDPTDDLVYYTPAPDFVGEDSFTYTIVDAYGRTSTATVTLTVTCASSQPSDSGDALDTVAMLLLILGIMGMMYRNKEEEIYQ